MPDNLAIVARRGWPTAPRHQDTGNTCLLRRRREGKSSPGRNEEHIKWGLQQMVVGVCIHNLHTIAPHYRELLALLVYLTWLLHWFPSSNPFVLRILWLRFTTLYKVLYVCSFSPTHACMGKLIAVAAWQDLGCPYFHPFMYDIFSTCTHVLGSGSLHILRTITPCYRELLALLIYLHVK